MKKYSLNVAKRHNAGVRFERWEHWCKIELPDSLTDKSAIARAAEIEHRWGLDRDFKFELTKWEETGRTLWHSAVKENVS